MPSFLNSTPTARPNLLIVRPTRSVDPPRALPALLLGIIGRVSLVRCTLLWLKPWMTSFKIWDPIFDRLWSKTSRVTALMSASHGKNHSKKFCSSGSNESIPTPMAIVYPTVSMVVTAGKNSSLNNYRHHHHHPLITIHLNLSGLATQDTYQG